MITDEALHAALSGALMQASSEGVAEVAVPAFGETADYLATMEAAIRSFQDSHGGHRYPHAGRRVRR